MRKLGKVFFSKEFSKILQTLEGKPKFLETFDGENFIQKFFIDLQKHTNTAT